MTARLLDLRAFFLLDEPPPGTLLATQHDPALVALSVAVAMLTSLLALQLAGAARGTQQPLLRRSALACGALALGAGVWAMHFIGMLAFQVCTTVAYRPALTAASMLPSLLAAGIALGVLARARLQGRQLLAGGLFTGAGIGVMHYSGMAALDAGAALRYDPAWFALSIVVAVALAVAALWIRFGLASSGRLSPARANLAGGAVLGLAISGMHYTAMAATRFVGTGDEAGLPLPARPLGLALAVAATTALVCLGAVGVNAALRYWQMIRQLARSQARLRATVQTAGDGIVSVDAAGRMRALNPAAERIFGWPAEAVLGQPLARLLPGLGALQPGQRLLAAPHADGRALWLRVSLAQAEDAGEAMWVALIADLTAARQRDAEFEGVVQAVQRGLMVIEFALDGTVLSASPPFLQLTGYTAASLVGRHHALLCRPDEPATPAYAEHWAALRRGEHRTGDFERVRADGRPVWIRATYNPILDADGRPLRIMKFVSDLSERHAMEQDLRLAKERAEAATQAKSSFLANMSHEIRTPMNAIIGFSELVLEGPLSADARGHLGTIRRSARSLLGLLNDILDTAKLDHGAVELERRPFGLRQLCRDLLATLRLGAQAKGLDLVLDLPDGPGDALPDTWLGDSLRVQQVLLNLVGNAIKFTERGSVTLRVRAAPGGLGFEVADTGIGIAADRLERIFDPFAQADASMTRRYGGTGLGTTIARQLVALMGGQIGVSSTPGQGSRFWFTLPLATTEAPAEADAGPLDAALPPLRILVADDVAENLALLQLRLGKLGHAVITATDGQAALARLQAELAGPGLDLALMDVQMPVLDGLSATRQLRAWEAQQGRAPLPVIALTAGVREADRRETLDAGMSGFATKPVDLPQLLAEVARVLGPQRLADAAARAQAPAAQAAQTAQTAQTARAAPAVPTAPAAADAAPVGDTAAATPAAALPPGRDWTDGLRRWGSATVLREQLLRHATQALAQLPASGHWPPAEPGALAHRLKGAAANLGLADVAAAAGRLEAAGDAAPPADWQALRGQLAALQAALLAQAAALPLQPQARAATAGAAADTTADTAAQADAQPARHPAPHPAPDWPRLRARLAAGELDEALLAPALAALPPAEAAALRDALDDFDFDRALHVVDRLQPETAAP